MSNLIFNKNIYPSSAYYVLKQLGLIPGQEDPKFLELGNQISALGKSFSLQSSLAGGPLFRLIYQIPSYLEITPIEFDKYFQSTSNFVKFKDLDIFLDRWPNKTKFFKQWYTSGWINLLSKSIDHDPSRALAIIETFLLILHDSWSKYENIYQDKLFALILKKENLEKEYNSYNIFDRWEKSFNNKYPYDNLEVIICPESNSIASSLGPEKLVIGSSRMDSCLNSLIHEIGLRMLNLNYFANNSYTRAIMKEDYHGFLVLMEAEICYRKKELFPEIKEDMFMNVMNMEAIVKWRTNKDVDAELAKSFAVWYNELKDLGML
ncbi:MAG: hypothetical protein ACLFPS_03835 [Clostridia bacterium]